MSIKASATDLARDAARLLSAAVSGRKVEIEKHGRPVASLQGVKTISGKRLARGLDRLKDSDRAALRKAIAEAMKAVQD